MDVSESLEDIKKVNVFTEGQFAVLHLDKGFAHKWDFCMPGNVYNALNSAVSGAEHAP